ncbi:MAG: cryptochrome/photolyase family protein [Actinomycetota bacterium]|nr:cryptochrome/photolyase family protein [Actinomycetota bacterium]
MRTVWVTGDQLNRRIGALADASPGDTTVLLVESEHALAAGPYHRQRLHLVVAAMRRFAEELRDAGFEVDLRRAATFRDGLDAHRRERRPETVIATEPTSRRMERRMRDAGVELVRSNQFLCHRDDFADWAADQRSLRMEDFYRWQRRRLGYLMDGDQPVTGRWNHDADNREPPPSDGSWPEPETSRLDELDDDVLAGLPVNAWGADPVGWWATSRRAALSRLGHFVDEVLPAFGPHEDAMTTRSWHLAHSMLSPYLNLGLLLPDEVCDRVEVAYRDGDVPINSAEGFIRQVIGWREYVWGLYWLWEDHAEENVLGHDRPLPPVFSDPPATDMRCVDDAVGGVHERGWVHHIQRLMILANLTNLAGIAPGELVRWMRTGFVDGAEWVMIPNVVGMGLWADGGRMSTKPYVSGGNYVNRMSDYCGDCRYDPKARTGDDACPFTTLYWDFLARHREVLAANARMGPVLGNLDRLSDFDDVRSRAAEVVDLLAAGRL